ncbi:MAG: hypothetical protein H7Y36_04965 [Armatimonadetes bacterium]|nr:hypothetical protein [Akkermansiaceae bacterium]
MFRLVTTIFALSIGCVAAGERIWQPIIDYTISFPGDRPDAAPMINSFENFTHFSSDFGWMGPGENRIDSQGGIIRVKPGPQWTGAWHSLAGLANQNKRTLDPRNLIGLGQSEKLHAKILELNLNASGHGTLRLELADATRQVVWSTTIELNNEQTVTYPYPIGLEKIGRIKFMNWIAEPDCDAKISSIGFIVEKPQLSPEEWAFYISLGKLRRCHNADNGLTRDRGHLRSGEFDSIASTGMHALGSALGVAEGLLDRELVSSEISQTIQTLLELPRAAGLFPHFSYQAQSGELTIHPNTEYSSIDTSIALHGLLLATQLLELEDLNRQVVAMISEIDFDSFTDKEGWIGHGFLDDGITPLTSVWRDWGGETALVLALEAMIPDRETRGKMNQSGEVYRGVGFISEIQSLFYPDFDRREPDLISKVSWPEKRGQLLEQQIRYIPNTWPESAAARAGIFGLSSGEAGMPGAGYSANGLGVAGVRWLYPHYMLMGLALSGGGRYHIGLDQLNAAGLLYPLGLPENIEVELKLHNPMQGSLNAAFETLSAYHGWRQRNTPENHLDQASLKNPTIRKAAARFYRQ